MIIDPEYGDRPDIELARDISEGTKRDNHAAKLDRISESPEWGDSECPPFSKVVLDLIEADRASTLFDFTVVNRDMDLHEAINEACINLGLDEDDYSPSITFNGFEAEVRLY